MNPFLVVPGPYLGPKLGPDPKNPKIPQNSTKRNVMKKMPSDHQKCMRFWLLTWFPQRIWMANRKLAFLKIFFSKVGSAFLGTLGGLERTRRRISGPANLKSYFFDPTNYQKKIWSVSCEIERFLFLAHFRRSEP